MVQTLVIGTTNRGKLREYEQLLSDLALELRSLQDFAPVPDVVEDGATFSANAIKKARQLALALSLPVLADDSGLVVDALGGAPGVYSARYAGEGASDAANVAKLLAALTGVGARSARFQCVVAVARPDGKLLTIEGACEGEIATAPRGELGFGYDPVFVPRGREETFAELAAAEKNRLSHRARALARLKPALVAFLGSSNPVPGNIDS